MIYTNEDFKIIIRNFLIDKNGNYIRKITSKFLMDNNIKDCYDSMLKMYHQVSSKTDIFRIIIENDGKDICSCCGVKLSSVSKTNGFVCKQCSKNVGYVKKDKTNIDRYGGKSYMSAIAGKEKFKNSLLDKYGVDNPYHIDGVEEKRKATSVKKYGIENVMKLENFKEKQKNTMFENHGKYHNFGARKEHKIHHIRNLSDTGKYFYDNIELLYQEYITSGYNLVDLSRTCDIPPLTIGRMFRRHGLPIIYRKYSTAQENMRKSIEEVTGLKFEASVRNVIPPFEIDVYNHENKFGVEYHGIYWHSNIDKNNHIIKYNMSKDRGVNLIQIFSNEWEKKQEIVKSIICSKLNKTTKIHGRKTNVALLSNKVYKDFCDTNHIQGYGIAAIRIGLFYNGELVSVMSFSKSRYDKNIEYEMVRFCNKLFTTVVGGASKLFKYFIAKYNPNSVVTYADARFSSGNMYTKLGFEFVRHSPPNFFYTKDCKTLESRVKYQKHKLVNMLEKFDENKTEIENMLDNGFRIVYDCGNVVFHWKQN